MTIHTRPGRKADVSELSYTLGRAFFDDPVSLWIMPEEKSRTRHLARFFGTVARYHHLAGGGVEVATDGSTIGAAALWDPPGRWKQSGREQLMMLPAFAFGFGPRLSMGRRLGELMAQMKAHHPEEPHWYLAVIGSDPSVRGKGYGQALMQSRLDRVDAEHAPAYLESSKAENVPYYQRFGFEVTGELVIPGGPTLWPMWRAPR
ncbi:GNAT family N-acetyltransferase [Mycobacterium paraterrae]|uniref:GNAT family N-acetyltransferase n=1 Tax=Mycobacterium paraterrae TaxID=577492 RepID=A0ABY3VRQ5_9MYCO|nr:GNAT family N-acetyltransferase [Mycobacterium paraterrae]UMB69334.1 GNAT family N-acetyltransferase [Mycobacterium paraterrae]